jgi:hypothetical protein
MLWLCFSALYIYLLASFLSSFSLQLLSSLSLGRVFFCLFVCFCFVLGFVEIYGVELLEVQWRVLLGGLSC